MTTSFTILAIEVIFNGIGNVCGGALRSLEKQTISSVVTAIAYYIISLPFAYMFAFKFGYGVIGLWVGNFCGVMFQLFGFVMLLCITDWQQVAD